MSISATISTTPGQVSEDELEVSPALQEARRRRADLHAALIKVEKAVSGPSLDSTRLRSCA